MNFDLKKTYTLIDREKTPIGEIHSIKPTENWYIGKVGKLNFPEKLEALFHKIEEQVKEKDFRSVRETEAELSLYQLHFKEANCILSEFQLDKKKKVYFKVTA